MNRPFVITIASEKGGVGKTTIATNLAVYLKALREDLPVTIASFDNHFSVDQMFALGPRPENDVSGLLESVPFNQLVNLGQYGVQYLASSRRLQQPKYEPIWLANQLAAIDSPGVLILDTRPILDWFSEAALLAADVVLTPIKDRAAMVNADALRQVLDAVGRTDRLWLLPSLVDTRARLNADVKVHEFLSYAAREREYQVLDIIISKSPKVEGLASGFSSSIRPVLTHARNTAVHGQFKQLAEFVLQRLEQGPIYTETTAAGAAHESAAKRRSSLECPLCARHPSGVGAHFFQSMRRRRRGYFHSACYEEFVVMLGFDGGAVGNEVISMVLKGPGLVDLDSCLDVHLCSAEGEVLESKSVCLDDVPEMKTIMEMIMGRTLDEAYRELVLVNCTEAENVDDSVDEAFIKKRKQIVREIHRSGLF